MSHRPLLVLLDVEGYVDPLFDAVDLDLREIEEHVVNNIFGLDEAAVTNVVEEDDLTPAVSTVEWVFLFGALLAFLLAFFDFFDLGFKFGSKIGNNVACLARNRSAVGSLFDVMPSAEEQV